MTSLPSPTNHKRMNRRHHAALGVLALLLAGCAGLPMGGAGGSGEVVLFDGTTLEGWRHVGPGAFVLQPDGSMLSDGGMGLLYYEQPFRDFTVVYARVGNTYEVRMLDLGRRTDEWTEVLGGIEPGTEYVVDGAFLIRADIEKSGASHDH